MLDGGREDPLDDMRTVSRELREYASELAERPQITVINKTDVPEVAARREELSERFSGEGIEPLFISAASGEGVDDLVTLLAHRLQEIDAAAETQPEPVPVVRPPAGRPGSVTVHRENGVFRIEGERAVAFAEMMPTELQEGREELWRRFEKWGVTGALRKAGAKRGDRVRLGRVELEIGA
jgi:GTP-binding protein